MGSAFTLTPDTSQTDLTTTATTATATTVTPMNTGGSGGTYTIIDTITIETMIGTTTGIDLLRFRITKWLSAPWTPDPILATFRFTGVFRELDRESQACIHIANSGPCLVSFE